MNNKVKGGRAPDTTQDSGSREAMLGSAGLRITKAVAEVPARPPRRDKPAQVGFTDPRGVRGMAPNASREAGLGGAAPEVRPAGGLATDEEPDEVVASEYDLVLTDDQTRGNG